MLLPLLLGYHKSTLNERPCETLHKDEAEQAGLVVPAGYRLLNVDVH